MPDMLHDQADRLRGRIYELQSMLAHYEAQLCWAVSGAQTDILEYAIQAVRDDLATAEGELEDIEEDLAWADWREERRDAPIVL